VTAACRRYACERHGRGGGRCCVDRVVGYGGGGGGDGQCPRGREGARGRRDGGGGLGGESNAARGKLGRSGRTACLPLLSAPFDPEMALGPAPQPLFGRGRPSRCAPAGGRDPGAPLLPLRSRKPSPSWAQVGKVRASRRGPSRSPRGAFAPLSDSLDPSGCGVGGL